MALDVAEAVFRKVRPMWDSDRSKAGLEPPLAQRLLADLRVGYAITDRQMRITEVAGDLGVLEGGAAAWIGRPLLDLVPELSGVQEALEELLSGALPRFELAWINREGPEGETYYLTTVDVPLRDEKGEIQGLLHIVQDSTQAGILQQQLTQRRNELRLVQDQLVHENEDLAASNAELRRLDELRSTFLSMAAHELRSPLTAIQGCAELLADEEVGPLMATQRDYLGIIQNSSQRLLHLINNMLDVTCIDAEHLSLSPEPTDLVVLVGRAIKEFGPQAATREQQLTLRAAPALPQVACDPDRAAQIVGNLLSNALKYTPREGHISLAVEAAAEEGFLQMSVADDGVGIPPEDQDRVFSRFFRAANATRTGASGAGLGLYITRALVELHGGRIWLSSEPGSGCTFYVTFPIAH